MIIVKTIAIYIVTAVIVLLATDLAARPVNRRIQNNYVQAARASLAQGQEAQAEALLTEALQVKRVDKTEVQVLANQFIKVKSDLLYAKDFYQDNGNQSQAEVVEKVLASYNTPKEMLEVVQYLLRNGEAEYAYKLYQRVGRIAPEYRGYLDMRKYFKTFES